MTTDVIRGNDKDMAAPSPHTPDPVPDSDKISEVDYEEPAIWFAFR
jgi:hypothetical protein